ncbi:hypothetical protein, partial [Yersinia mollaretii]|uniref:hypothetical protein n=1 Tax=Yersinia mollaretii TaxID=33060 RepID=UPI001C956007
HSHPQNGNAEHQLQQNKTALEEQPLTKKNENNIKLNRKKRILQPNTHTKHKHNHNPNKHNNQTTHKNTTHPPNKKKKKKKKKKKNKKK